MHPMIRPLSPEPDLADQVHSSLLEAILSGTLEPGERYTQESLAERLGVSRQPVIQALRLLRMQGLIVETANRRGVTVAPLDAAFVGWLYELRAALDSAAARAAARRPRADLREEGTAILKEGRAAIAAGDLDRLVKADLRFHLFVYEAAGNPLLLDTARQHWHHTRRAMGAYVRRATAMGGIWAEHAAILDAIVAGNGERAAQLSHDHAANSVRTLLAGSGPTNEPDEPAARGRRERAASGPRSRAASASSPDPTPSPKKRRHG